MLADSQLFFIWTALLVLIFWIIPGENPRLRQWWAFASSFLFVFTIAPEAAVLVSWMVIAAHVGCIILATRKNPALLWVFIVLICLPLLSQRTFYTTASLIATLGVTFATLKAVSILVDTYNEGRREVDLLSNATFLFFLPLYTVGPIEKSQLFLQQSFSVSFSLYDFFRGIGRICIGLFKSAFIADQLIRAEILERFPADSRYFGDFNNTDTIIFISLSFLFTYVNFSAFVDVAIGVSRTLGFKTIENFNFPLLARNLQDFWKRWHISLGAWITKYLYLPLVFAIGKKYAPYIGSLVAFTLIGWWHESSANYIAWGFLHGVGLCVVQAIARRNQKLRRNKKDGNLLGRIAAWALTLFYVAWVQTIANLNTFDDALALTKSMLW